MEEEIENYVYPGKKIAVIEEYVPGDGTYAGGDGFIRGKLLGIAKTDPERREVKVSGRVRVNAVKEGDEVAGVLMNLSGVYGTVNIGVLNGKLLKTPVMGIVYPSGVLRRGGKQYRVGDIIFARVVSRKNRILHLSIDGSRYGVVKARCNDCGGEMVVARRRPRLVLKCSRCGVEENRKISSLYSKIA